MAHTARTNSEALRSHAPASPTPRSTATTTTVQRTASRQRARVGRIRAILDLLPDAVVVADAQFQVIFVNRRTELLFGYQRAELLGRPIDLLVPQRLRAAHVSKSAGYFVAPDTRSVGGPLPLFGLRRDGSEFPIEITVAPLYDEGEPLVIASIRDVSDVQRVQAANRELRLMQALTDTALTYVDLDELLPNLLLRVHDVMAVDNAIVRLLAHDGQELRVTAGYGPDAAIATELPVPMDDGFSGRIAANRQPLLVDDLPAYLAASPAVDPRLYAQLRSALGIPLVLHDRVLGVLHVSTREPRHFTEQDIQLLQRVAERVAVAVERAQLFEAERAARQEAERERIRWLTAMESATEFVITCDAELRRTYVNPAYVRLRGGPADPSVPEEELSSRYGLFLPDGKTLFPANQLPLTRAVNEGKPIHGVEMVLHAGDGQERLVVWESAPMYTATGELLGAISIGHDITERRQLEREREDALRRSEEWFRSMANTAPVLLWVAGTDALVAFVNDPWLQFTGRTLEQELGNGWADGVHPDDYRRCLETYLTAFHAHRRFTMTYRLRRADGEYRWVLDNGVPRFAADGTFEGYIGSCTDVTEREELRQEREMAEVREQAATEATKRLDQFFAMASHDIRGPVTALTGNVQLARQRADLLAAELQEHDGHNTDLAAPLLATLDRADESGERLQRLVPLLFDVARARSGTLTLKLAPCDLAALVSEQVTAQHAAVPGRTIQLDLPEHPVQVEADVDRLSEVLTNYLTNALKYSPDDQPIEVRLQATNGLAVVSVRDHGPGLSEEEQRRVWELYHRAPGVEVQGSACGSTESLGMGLHIAKQLIELHPGGAVGVKSMLGEGATFWFRLPLAAET